MRNADKNRDPEVANKRAMSDARCAWRKMTEAQRQEFLRWTASHYFPPNGSLTPKPR